MRVLKLVGFIVLGALWIVSALWFFQRPGFETVVAYLTSTGALFTLDVVAREGRHGAERRQHDKALIAAFREELPFRPTIEFLRDEWLSATFQGENLWPLDDFCRKWTDAAHEFNDSALERQKLRLVQAGNELCDLVSRLTWDIGEGARSVKGNWDEGEEPEQWEERGRTLDAAAAIVVNAHQELERKARRWEGAKPIGEALALGVAAIALAFPSVGLWKVEHDHSESLTAQLRSIQVAADSLRARAKGMELRLSQLPRPSQKPDSSVAIQEATVVRGIDGELTIRTKLLMDSLEAVGALKTAPGRRANEVYQRAIQAFERYLRPRDGASPYLDGATSYILMQRLWELQHDEEVYRTMRCLDQIVSDNERTSIAFLRTSWTTPDTMVMLVRQYDESQQMLPVNIVLSRLALTRWTGRQSKGLLSSGGARRARKSPTSTNHAIPSSHQ